MITIRPNVFSCPNTRVEENTSRMNGKLLLIITITVVALLRSTALAIDNRFDGVWVGTETVLYEERAGIVKIGTVPQSKPAKIAIAQGGTLLGVLEGYGIGRYNDVRRVGNTIVFHAGQRTGQLTLSTDGNTLTEKGIATVPVLNQIASREGALPGNSGPQRLTLDGKPLMCNVPLTGVFRRAK
jgi:hypothetical protein